MREDVLALLRSHKGHFLLESGHHGDLWLELERLCLQMRPVERFAAELAARLSRHQVEVVCGPLVEGAFLALLVALKLHLPFTYSERLAASQENGLYGVRYRVPDTLRPELAARRVAIVNDVINAGSAVRGTFADLEMCGASTVVIGSLVVLGSWARQFCDDHRVGLEALATMPGQVWEPSACPLCAAGQPLVDLTSAVG